MVTFNKNIVGNVGECMNSIIQEAKDILNYIILKDVWKYHESSKEFRPKTTSQKLQNVLMDIQYQLLSTGIYNARITEYQENNKRIALFYKMG